MPDENVMSFIAWCNISFAGGLWFIGELFFSLASRCLVENGVEPEN